MPLLLTLSFGKHVDPDHLDRIIAANKEIHQQRLDRYRTDDHTDMSAYQRATLEFGIGYERTVLAWFDRLPELLGR